MERSKRGQITIFVIVAVLIVAASVLFFAYRGNISALFGGNLSPDAEQVHSFVQNCLRESSADVIYSVGYGGGYIVPPNLSGGLGFPIYYADGKSYMPSKERIGEEISNFTEQEVSSCVGNFDSFKNLNLTSGKIKIQTQIKDDKVLLNAAYPITISKDGVKSSLEKFSVEIPVRLGTVYNSANEIIQDQLTHSDLCLTCILDVSLKNDLRVDMADYDNRTIIFSFRDDNSKLNNTSFEFIFANRY